MNKPVSAVLNTVRALIGIQSQQKLHDEQMRLLIHTIITDYDNFRIDKKEQDDRFVHSTPCGVSTDEENGDFIVYFGEGDDDEIREFVPVYLYYKDPNQPNGEFRIYMSTLQDYAIDSAEKCGRQKVGAFYGNNYDQYRLGMRLKLNMTPVQVAAQEWRLVFKKSFTGVLSYDQQVPFPPAHTGLIESALAIKCLDIVDDYSTDWEKKRERLRVSLTASLQKQEIAYMNWLKSDPKARTRNLSGYDYKARTRRTVSGRFVEPIGGNQ